MIDRRAFLLAGVLAPVACRAAVRRADRPERWRGRFEAIRASLGTGARLGVAAVDAGTGRTLGFDAGSRYAMASTFKLPLAAMVLKRVEAGQGALDEAIAFGPADLLDNSPVVEANLRDGRLPVRELCAAIVERSDNAAANLLLRRFGGPPAVTAFARACGDRMTRLDRTEMALNSNLPGDPRDTTRPAAMAGLVRRLLAGGVLTEPSRRLLAGWLVGSVPGPDRLKAGLPAGWTVGHKTGTGANGAVNDVAVAWRRGRAPVVVACYQSGGAAGIEARAAAHAAVGRLVAEAFA